MKQQDYADYQAAMEVICAFHPMLLDTPEDLEKAIKDIEQYYKNNPGPIGWKPPARDKIKEWASEALKNATDGLISNEKFANFFPIDAKRARKIRNV